MRVSSRTSLYLASTALGLSLAAHSASASVIPLPGLTNLDFTQVQSQPSNTFSNVNPTGWSGGTGLIFIDSPTPGKQATDGNNVIQTYGDPVGSVPGNYVEADGNPHYESGFNYQLSGLTVGQKYSLSFYQGASQQVGFHGDTTNQWIVALGATGSTLYTAKSGSSILNTSCGSSCVYLDSDTNAHITNSPLMSVPSGSAVGWNYVSVTVTADATNDVLSFLAWGDNGNTANLPPMAFLAGVNSPPGLGVPEPASLSVLGIGLVGLSGVVRRRRRRAKTLASA